MSPIEVGTKVSIGTRLGAIEYATDTGYIVRFEDGTSQYVQRKRKPGHTAGHCAAGPFMHVLR